MGTSLSAIKYYAIPRHRPFFTENQDLNDRTSNIVQAKRTAKQKLIEIFGKQTTVSR